MTRVSTDPILSDRAPAPRAEPPLRASQRVLSVPMVVGTFLVLLVLLPAAHVWHSYQCRLNAGALRQRAEELAADEKWADAAEYLRRYMAVAPDDSEACIRLARIYDRSNRGASSKGQGRQYKERAVQLYFEAIAVAPAEQAGELRFRLAELLCDLDRFSQAEEQIRAADPSSPQGLRLRAIALFGASQTGELAGAHWAPRSVGKAIEDALEANPGDIELTKRYVTICHEQPGLLSERNASANEKQRGDLAYAAVNRMATKNPASEDARLFAFMYCTQHQLPGAEEHLAESLKIAPQSPRVLLATAENARLAAMRKRQAGESDAASSLLEVARKHYQQATEVAPALEEGYLRLAEVLRDQGRSQETLATLRRGLANSRTSGLRLRHAIAEVLVLEGPKSESEIPLAEQVEKAFEDLNEAMEQSDAGDRIAYRNLQQTRDLLRATWLRRQGRLAEAVSLLKGVTTADGLTRQSVRYEGFMALGDIYGSAGQWDLAAAAFERTVQLLPELETQSVWPSRDQEIRRSLEARSHAALGKAREAAGLVERAISEYGHAAARVDSAENRIALARARLRRQLALPKQWRDWRAFRDALRAATESSRSARQASPWTAALLEATYLVAEADERGQREQGVAQAAAVLRKAEEGNPQQIDLFQNLVLFYENVGQRAEADRLLEALAKLPDSKGIAELTTARILALRGDHEKAKSLLLAAAADWPAEARQAAALELVQIDLQAGRRKEAKSRLAAVQAASAANLGLLVTLAEMACEDKDFVDLEVWRKKIADFEGGANGFAQYLQAKSLVAQANGGDDPKLIQAESVLRGLKETRPNWSLPRMVAAAVHEIRGQWDDAVKECQEALRLGDERVEVYERLIHALLQAQRASEVEQFLIRLGDRASASRRLAGLDISVAVRRDDVDGALQAARSNVERRPKDAMAHVWLGHVLLLKEQTAAAQKAFENAVQLAPGERVPFTALFRLYVRTRQRDPASKLLEEHLARAKLIPADAGLLKAVCYEQLGDTKRAEVHYREAFQAAPENQSILLATMTFFLRNNPSEGESLLREAMKTGLKSEIAQRVLGSFLAVKAGSEASLEAERLMRQAADGATSSASDRRRVARLLARRGGSANLRKARELLERLASESKSIEPNDRLLLAGLYEAEGNLKLAEEQHRTILKSPNAGAAEIAAYAQLLLRHKRFQEAGTWLEKLEKLAPNDLQTLALRARWLKADGRAEQIATIVESFLRRVDSKVSGNTRAEVQLWLAVGNLYSDVHEHKTAESWYRRVKAAEPRNCGPLAVCLARQGRVGEAIQECLSAQSTDGSLLPPAMAITEVLIGRNATGEHYQLAEPLLARATQQHRDNPALMSRIATLRIVQNRIDEAVSMFEQAVRLDPTNVLALNNLATLLAEQDGRLAEAMKHVDRAIDIAGPKPDLADTKGYILLLDGKYDDALGWLHEAVSLPNPDPRYRLHLAAAYQRMGKKQQAREAFSAIGDGALDNQILTRIERSLLAELAASLQ